MPTSPAPLCTHRFLDDHICGSPALRGESYCYHHHPSRRPCANPYERRARRGFNLPAPKTHQDLALALSEVIQRLASNRIDVHRAGLLLYSLQLAGQNL
jgi:hypothetical protein